jgi:hypothetical protein
LCPVNDGEEEEERGSCAGEEDGEHCVLQGGIHQNYTTLPLGNCLTSVIGCVTAMKMRLRTLLHSRRSQADAVGSYAKSMKGVTCDTSAS